jgi:hypothetical protein
MRTGMESAKLRAEGASALREPSSHVFVVKRQRGPQWYAKYRLPDGRQVQKRIGAAWTQRGTPTPGYLNRRMAETWLADPGVGLPSLRTAQQCQRPRPVTGSREVRGSSVILISRSQRYLA